MAQHVVVSAYDPLWKQMYAEEAGLIKKILGGNCVAIFHIGSTAVEGIRAKPVIDIMPVVKDLDMVDRLAGEFEKTGYEYLGEFGIAGRRYLRKGGDERTHQMHIFRQDDTENIERHLAVREYLQSHEEAARRYGQLKAGLARRYPYDIERYCDGKEEFVKRLEALALQWKRNQT